MDGIFSSFVHHVPWLPIVLSWLVAILLIIALLMFPAYYLFLPLFRQARARAKEWAIQLRDRHVASQEARRAVILALAEKFRVDNLLKRVWAASDSLITGAALLIKRQLNSLRKQMKRAAELFAALGVRSDKLTKALKAATFTPGGAESQLEELTKSMSQTSGVAVARSQLIIGVVLLIGVIFLNTVMLSQILLDLGLIPSRYVILGVPLVYYLAMFFSALEAGLGYWHATLAPSHDEILKPQQIPPKMNIPSAQSLFVLALTLIMSLFEAQNWSSIAPAKQVVEIPFTESTMRKSSFYFLVGFAIVWILFGLGSVCYRALAKLKRGSAPGKLAKLLDRIVTAEDHLSKVRTAKEQHAQISVEQESFVLLKQELDRLEVSEENEFRLFEADLTVTEVLHLSNYTGFWIVATGFGVAIATVTGQLSFAAMLPLLNGQLFALPAIAFGQALLWCAIGILFASRETVMKSTSRVVVKTRGWSIVFAVVLIILLFALFLWGFLSVPGLIRLVWALNLISGVGLSACGYKLKPLLGIATLWVLQVRADIRTAIEFVARVFVGILFGILAVLTFIAEGFAMPILLLKKKPTGGDGKPDSPVLGER
jgi:hypothetical protein